MKKTGPKTSRPPHSKPRSCRYCQASGHSSAHCTVLADTGSRATFIRTNRLCFNCLGNHRVADCPSKSRCQKCHQKHHTSTCRQSSSQPRRDDAQQQRNTSPTIASAVNSVEVNTAAALATSAPHPHILLKTAVSTVMSPVTTQTTTASILFDEGAQRSFISQELADDLQLPITTYEQVQLSTFGGQSSSRQCPLVAINVLDEQGEPIRLHTLIVPEIASLVQHGPSTALISGCLHNLR